MKNLIRRNSSMAKRKWKNHKLDPTLHTKDEESEVQ
jgi:hypothetical protein